MNILKSLFGELHWTAPPWARGLRLKTLLGRLAGLVVAAVVIFAAYAYYQSLPKPARVIARAAAPGITPIVDGELRPEPLRIDFSVVRDPGTPLQSENSVARIDLLGRNIEDGIALEPFIAGEWRWLSETQLSFQPRDDWPAGQAYTVRYEPTLFAEGLELADTRVRFTTPEFSASLDELIFYQDPVERSLREVVATLSFTHPVDPASLEERVSYVMRESGETVEAEPRMIEHRIEYDEHRRQAFVHSAALEIPPRETYASLQLAENLAPQTGPSRFEREILEEVTIPDIGSYFRVDDVQSLIVRNEDDEPEQTITLEFTDWVRTDDLENRLKLYLLPTEATIDGRTVRNMRWRSPREVTAEVLAQAVEVEATINPAENGTAQFHSIRVDVPADRDLYVLIEQGLRSDGGFEMSLPYDTVLRAPRYPIEATIAQDGAIVTLSGSHRLTFVSRGVESLRVDIGRLIASEVNHLASQTGGDLRSPYFNNYSFNEDNISIRETRFIDLDAGHPKTATYSSLDLSEFLPDGGYYFISVQGWDRNREQPIGIRDQRFVLITDLDLLVKSNVDSSQDIFVHSISTGRPVSGARVDLLGRNGVAIVQRLTRFDGHARMPPVDDFEREKAPTVYVVRLGDDSIFMPYSRGGRMLQYSRFDVGGERIRLRTDAERLRAQVFTDRGLYRPGDAANIAAIVKNDDWSPTGNLPLILSVRDPNGQTVVDKRFELPDDGFFEDRFETEAVSPTGNYIATLYLVDERERRRAIGSQNFKVEEFLPDRLRIRSEIAGQKPVGWLKPGELVCDVTLENLFGTPAEARRVTGDIELTPTAIRLSGFPDFVFDDPLREAGNTVQPVRQTLAEARTDRDGSARLPFDLSQYDRGIYRLTVFTEGFEEGGGRSVKAQASVVLSPLDYLIGHKADGDLGFVNRNSARSVRYQAVDSNAEPVALDDLSLSIVEERFVSTLVRQPNGTYAYQSILQEEPVSSQAYSIAAEGNEFTLPTDRPGRFAVKISNGDGLVFSRLPYTVAGAGNLAGNLERNAELSLALNGQSFEPGAEIEMEITAPYTGSGLITIERDRVYAYKWFQSTTTSTVQTIRVPGDLEGNAYVNVAFIRDIDSPEIFVSPLSYAVEPFAIDRAARTVEIELDVPELVRPGETLAITYQASRPSRAVVYAVDEGILQVADYRMPDPVAFFLRKMALQVTTFQMADLILPEFEAFRRLAAPGGGAAEGLLGRNLNPFRRRTEAPVVFWSGIVESGPDARTVSYEVPDYFNGRLRVMAVAVADSAVGAAEDTSIVRGPFVITPNLLTAAAPGDEFDVTVGLANNLEGSGESSAIALSLTPSEHLEVVGDSEAELAIDEGREGRATFRVRATDRLGSASLAFVARAGDESARLESTLSVRPSVPYVTTLRAGNGDDDPMTLDFERGLHDEFAVQSAAASASPLILADGLLGYLEDFPHACAEQIVSKVFPQIGFLGNRDYEVDEAHISESFDDTVRKLRPRQTPEGGFRFWATSREPADFPSVYIMHFFTDAAALGLSVPRDMLDSGRGYLRQLATREARSLPDARLRAYAIYVLTRNGIVTTNYLTDLHEFLDRQYPGAWESDLTAVYMAAAYQMLRQTDLGARLVGDYRMGAGDEMAGDFDTRLGRDAQYVYLLSRHFPNRLGDIDADAIQNLVAPIMQNRFNTLSSAYTVLALGAYTRAVLADSAAGDLRLTISDASGDAAEILAEAALFARAKLGNDVDRVRVSGAGDTDIYYVLTQSGYDREMPAGRVADGLEIFREYLDADDNPVDSARIGDELTVQLRLRSTGRRHTNVAVVDMLPGGFEVQTDSIRDQYGGWSPDYKDIREDRVVVYGSFGDRITEIRYRVRATAAGDFVVPSAYAGSMYDRSVQARTEAGRFQVSAAQ